MRNTAKLNWLKDREREFRKTGKLDISGEMLENLSFIGSRPTMKTLDLSFTSIRSFEGLPPQPKLEYIILDGSMIESFKNGLSISSISKISIRNTPASKIPNYKLSLLILCDNLRIIDDRIVPNKLKQKAEKYPPICRKLVNQGWIAEYPCPSKTDLIDICFNYGLNYQEETEGKSISSLNEIPLYEEKDIDEIISKYSSKHKKMLQKAKEKLENIDNINPYDSRNSASIDLTVTSENSSVNTNHEFTFSLNQESSFSTNDNFQIPYPQDEEERNESFISYNPNLLSYRVSAIIKKYGFDIDDDGDRVSTIVSALDHIFKIAEGKDVDFPHVLMDGNIIALEDDFEEDEEESSSEDLNAPKKTRTNVTFDFSNQGNNRGELYRPTTNILDEKEYKETNMNIQKDLSDHLFEEYNEEEEKNRIDISQSSSSFLQQHHLLDENENEAEQKKDEVEGESLISISAIEGEGQLDDSLLQQQKMLMQDDNEDANEEGNTNKIGNANEEENMSEVENINEEENTNEIENAYEEENTNEVENANEEENINEIENANEEENINEVGNINEEENANEFENENNEEEQENSKIEIEGQINLSNNDEEEQSLSGLILNDNENEEDEADIFNFEDKLPDFPEEDRNNNLNTSGEEEDNMKIIDNQLDSAGAIETNENEDMNNDNDDGTNITASNDESITLSTMEEDNEND